MVSHNEQRSRRFLMLLGLQALRLARRIVIPISMRRIFMTGRTLRDLPLDPTTRANAAGPKGVPAGATGRYTIPAVLGLGPVFAFRAVDFRVDRHRVILARRHRRRPP